jgi:hypothetical protein
LLCHVAAQYNQQQKPSALNSLTCTSLLSCCPDKDGAFEWGGREQPSAFDDLQLPFVTDKYSVQEAEMASSLPASYAIGPVNYSLADTFKCPLMELANAPSVALTLLVMDSLVI